MGRCRRHRGVLNLEWDSVVVVVVGEDFLQEVTFTLKSAELGISVPCRGESIC